MPRVLNATCVGGVVTCGSGPISGVTLLSEGVASSEGYLIIDENRKYYVAKVSPDLKTTLEKIVTALTQVKTALDQTVSALTAIDTHAPLVTSCGAGAGTATWVPVAASNISSITTAATQIETVKTQLDTLKGSMK